MYPATFNYHAPKNANEAIKLLRTLDEPKILAGGQSLISLMKLRLVSPKNVIDLSNLKGLAYINEEKNGSVSIGALTTHDALEHSEILKRRCYLLSEAASKIGDQQIRNRGTIGGSLCHADPAADLLPAILALEAKMVVKGPKKTRSISAEDFFVDTFATGIRSNEILASIRIPKKANMASAFVKHSRREGDFAITNVAVSLTLDRNNVCETARIALGAVAPTPIRSHDAESYLEGKKLTKESIAETGHKAMKDANVQPPSDMHGSAAYRKEMVRVFTKRALELALSRRPTRS